MKVKYFLYEFDNGYFYFDYTIYDLKHTDIMFRYKTNSVLYDIFIDQKKFRPIQLIAEKDLEPKDIVTEREKILRKLNIAKNRLIQLKK